MPVKDHRWKPVLRITGSLPFKHALSLLDIRVVDHIVVSGADCTSFAETGLL